MPIDDIFRGMDRTCRRGVRRGMPDDRIRLEILRVYAEHAEGGRGVPTYKELCDAIRAGNNRIHRVRKEMVLAGEVAPGRTLNFTGDRSGDRERYGQLAHQIRERQEPKRRQVESHRWSGEYRQHMAIERRIGKWTLEKAQAQVEARAAAAAAEREGSSNG